jgi:N6-adenosine-specific RNA methylase IME4
LVADLSKEEADKQVEKWRNFEALPQGRYDVIYADPPWRYDFSRSNSRSIEAHYPTMTIEEICELKIPSAKDSVLFLWATSPKLREALRVVESWNFDYKTSMVWVKDKVGMGYYARGQHEILFIGTKGEVGVPAPAKRRDSVIYAPVGEHSKKPEILYEIIESMYPGRDYLELFARSKHDGWKTWGLEV